VETALRRIADTLLTFVDDTVARYGGEVWWPSNWPLITWVLIAALLILLWVASRRQRRPRGLEVRPPQLLVTNGEVVPHGSGDGPASDRSAAGRRRLDAVVHAASGTLAMTVSNLSRYPVQVLEVALRDEPRGAPRVVAVDAVVPAMGSVTVEGPVPLALRGDGWLDLYCYAAATRAKMHRHRVELVWEPWSARFKVAPLEQAVVTVRRLASDEPRARFLDDAVVGAAAAPADDDAAVAPAPVVADEAVRTALGTPEPEAVAPVAVAVAPEPKAPPAPRARPAARTDAAARATPHDEADGGREGRYPVGTPEVPRIATPPVGVAVTGRGGTAARAPGGYPIGRPRAAPPAVPASGGDATADLGAAVGTAAAHGADAVPGEDERDAAPGDAPAAAAAADRGLPTIGRSAPRADRAGPAVVRPEPERVRPEPERVRPEPEREPTVPGQEAAPPKAAEPEHEPEKRERVEPERVEPERVEPERVEPQPEQAAAAHDDAATPPDRAAPAPDAKTRRPRLAFPDEF
jgi:hypothetical protein